MKQVYILIVVIALLLGVSWFMKSSNPESQDPALTTEMEGDDQEALDQAFGGSDEGVQGMGQDAPASAEGATGQKNGTVISRPVEMENEKGPQANEPQVDQYGRKVMNDEPPPDKDSIDLEEEYNDEKENPEDYNRVPMPEEDMTLEDYNNSNKKKRDE